MGSAISKTFFGECDSFLSEIPDNFYRLNLFDLLKDLLLASCPSEKSISKGINIAGHAGIVIGSVFLGKTKFGKFISKILPIQGSEDFKGFFGSYILINLVLFILRFPSIAKKDDITILDAVLNPVGTISKLFKKFPPRAPHILDCNFMQERQASLCYKRIKDDKDFNCKSSVCWRRCPPGHKNLGAFCTRNKKKKCPTFTTWNRSSCTKHSKTRGVGKPISSCKPWQRKVGALCYDMCDKDKNLIPKKGLPTSCKKVTDSISQGELENTLAEVNKMKVNIINMRNQIRTYIVENRDTLLAGTFSDMVVRLQEMKIKEKKIDDYIIWVNDLKIK